ncbi:MAG: hypothetical protein ACW992_07150, partial [Candidatus Thorarchaeota archaeon]
MPRIIKCSLHAIHLVSARQDVAQLSSEQISHMFKLVALGDGAVGKTSCIRRFTEDSFS